MMKKNHEKWSEKELEIIYLISMDSRRLFEYAVMRYSGVYCNHVPFV